MEMKTVKSSMMHSIGHDPVSNKLVVKFKEDGPEFHYDGVSADAHRELLEAKSIGVHFGTHIKGNYKHAKIEQEKKI